MKTGFREDIFININLALKLKEIGFDEPCVACYNRDGKLEIMKEDDDSGGPFKQKTTSMFFSKCYEHMILAPTWHQASDWFRNEHNINISINPQHNFISEIELTCGTFPNGKYGGTLDDVTIKKEMVGSDTITLTPTMDSHREALVEAMKYAIIEINKKTYKPSIELEDKAEMFSKDFENKEMSKKCFLEGAKLVELAQKNKF